MWKHLQTLEKHHSRNSTMQLCGALTGLTLALSVFVSVLTNSSPVKAESEFKCKETSQTVERYRFVTQKKVKAFVCRDGLLQFVGALPPQRMVTVRNYVDGFKYRFVVVQLESGRFVLIKQQDIR